ncbi:MAG TPA: T9SS type A sorting domain-containing protein, partial [Bacteroidia bacterium]
IEAQGNELLVGGNGSNGFAFLMKVRSGGSQRWVRKSKPFTLQRMNFRQLGVDIKGSYFFSCDGMDPNGYYYLALTHADSAGVVDWARTYQFSTSSAYLYNGGVIQTWDKGYLLNAMLADTISGLLNAKVDSLGFIQDARIYPGPVYDSLNALRFSNSADQGFVCASDTGAMIYKMDGFGFMGCSGTPVVLTVDTPSCFDFSAGSIASAGSAVAQPQVINVTTLQVNSINTCTGTGIRDIKNYTGLLLFPNPSDGNFYVKAEGVKRVSAFDVAGRCVPIHLEVQQENSFVHLDGPPGIYFIKVITDKGAFTKKVIIN